jgi:hypothetical protein
MSETTPPASCTEADAAWLYRLLRKESSEAHDAARNLRTTNPPAGLSRKAFDIMARAHDEAAKAYDRAINFHCAQLARQEKLRRIE